MKILITGATGTFGKAFVDLYAKDPNVEKIILFSRDEFKQHHMMFELTQKFGNEIVNNKFKFFLGDIRDKERLAYATKGMDVVVHAAALKHITFCESNPSEAILTNVDGTKNVCDVSIRNDVKKLIVLSTDKAAEPINSYGATKMLAEKYAIHSNLLSEGKTRISCVRYGNIFGSRGSIVELFKSQLQNGDCFSITDAEMTRFWMHINTAAKLVMWSIHNIIGGEIVIPKIKASKLLDVAYAIDKTKKQNIVGIRPGEKLHEQLFSRRENLFAYESDKEPYYVVLPESNEFSEVKSYYENSWNRCNRAAYTSNDVDLQMTIDDLCDMIKGAF